MVEPMTMITVVSLRYVRCGMPYAFLPDKGRTMVLRLEGVGRGTTLEHIPVSYAAR